MPSPNESPATPTMALFLFHGRHTPDDVLDDWGFEAPPIPGVARVHVTYLSTFAVEFCDAAALEHARAQTGWAVWEENTLEMRILHEMVVAIRDDVASYYGDWSLSIPSGT